MSNVFDLDGVLVTFDAEGVRVEDGDSRWQLKLSKGRGLADSISRHAQLVFGDKCIALVVAGSLYVVNRELADRNVQSLSDSVCFLESIGHELIVVDRGSVFLQGEDQRIWEHRNIVIDGFEKVSLEQGSIRLVGDSRESEKEIFVFEVATGKRQNY